MSINNLATEDQEQAALFQWALRAACTMPELDMLFAIPNGGLRNKAVAVRLKTTGVRAGIPDTCLPVARGNYHGMFIELKRVKGGVLSASQKVWLNALNEQGYRAVVCKGWEQARDEIIKYLEAGA